MPTQRGKPERIVRTLRQIDVSIANGKTTPQACKEAEITIQCSMIHLEGNTENVWLRYEVVVATVLRQ